MTAGGRFRGSRPPVPFVVRRTPAASEPGCPCGEGPISYAGNPRLAANGGTDTSPLFVLASCPAVVDMTITATVNGWANNDGNDMSLVVREDSAGHYYRWRIRDDVSTGVPYVNSYFTLTAGNPGFGETTLDGPTLATRPSPGDVLKLSVVGDAIEASINGVAQMSVVDASWVPAGVNSVAVWGQTWNAWSVDISTEDFCP